MDFLDLVQKRYSVRQYQPREVEKEKLDYMLECARLAPSAVNRQPWHFYVVQSGEKRQELARCYARDWFAQAPLYIVVCADDANAWVRASDGHNHADIDVAIATEHLCLAATAQGLGTCWVCNFDVELCRQTLGLPEGLRPAVLVPVGYPADGSIPEKKRKDGSEIISYL